MFNLNKKWYVLIFIVLLATLGWCTFEIVNDMNERKRISSLPDKQNELPYFKPIHDTDVMRVVKASYFMGGGRVVNGYAMNDVWDKDSVLLTRFLNKLKHNQNDYSKTN